MIPLDSTMKVRFQADADLNQVILLATIRREPAIDFQTAMTGELAGVADPEVLAIAAKDGRVLVTHDRKTMPRHFAEFIAHETSPGLSVIPQSLSVAAAVEDLILIWSATEAEVMGKPHQHSSSVKSQVGQKPARRWVSLHSTHPTKKRSIAGWVEERNPSVA